MKIESSKDHSLFDRYKDGPDSDDNSKSKIRHVTKHTLVTVVYECGCETYIRENVKGTGSITRTTYHCLSGIHKNLHETPYK